MGLEQLLNAVLLPEAGLAMRPLVLANGGRAVSQDASYLPFIVEDLIRFTAVDLAIDPGSMYYEAVDRLPSPYKQRVRRVDKNGAAIDKTHYVLGPVWGEFGLEFSHVRVEYPEGIDERVPSALLTLTHALYRFIIGCDYQVQVDVDPEGASNAIEVLLQVVRGADARANLATLDGIFRSYERRDVPSLVVRSERAAEVGQRFREFVEDETYRRMAGQATLLGIPARATHAVVRMRRAALELLVKPRFEATVDLAAQSLQTSTGLPVPTAKPVRTLLGRQPFLPPLVRLREAQARATSAWTNAAPPFIPVSRAEYFANAEALPPDSRWNEEV